MTILQVEKDKKGLKFFWQTLLTAPDTFIQSDSPDKTTTNHTLVGTTVTQHLNYFGRSAVEG